MQQQNDSTGGTAAAAPASGQSRARLYLLVQMVALIVLVAVFMLVRNAATENLRQEAMTAAQLRVQALESVLAKQRAVAAILSDDAAVRAELTARLGGSDTPEASEISRKLDRLKEETQSEVIYLLDLRGVAVAASNSGEQDSFVGADYSFRDYFGQALREGTALQFALGTVSHRPGLYLSHDVRDGGRLLGVVVVKVSFDAMEANWAASNDETFVTTPAGEVVLSGRPALRFGPMPAIGGQMLAVSTPVPGAGWQLTLAVPSAPALQLALLVTGTLAMVMLIGGVVLGRGQRRRRAAQERAEAERRYRGELEEAVATRTSALRQEMHERQQAEQRLARMQADLVQANKLATLGQVTAGIAHEVNQPLATIRLLAENGLALLPRRAPAEVTQNLSAIVRMADRIAQITTELRSFARKATGHTQPVSLREVLEASVLLTASRRRAEGARIIMPQIDPGLKVMAEAVRLEQVLVNLIQNAHEALAGHPDPEIRIDVTEGGEGRVIVSVADNGPGLAPEIAAQLFTPFATSKPDGLGLGLVIAQGIVRDFGGELRAAMPERGAEFQLDLARVLP